MKGGNNQVWVTSAVTDDEVRDALVLGSSLKRTLTPRRVAIIVSPKVEEELRNKLYYVFDLVFFSTGDPKNAIGLKPEDWARLTAIAALGTFEHAVYLSPSMVAVGNADRIFDEFGVDNCGDLVVPQSGSLKMFLFKPSLDLYHEVVSGLKQYKNGPVTDLGCYLNKKFKNGLGIEKFDGKYLHHLQAGNVMLRSEKDIALIDLSEVDPLGEDENLEKFCMIGKCMIDHWQRIHREDVQPLMVKGEFLVDPNLKKFIPKYENEPIAVVGMSCRFPKSNNLEEFWNLLFEGGDGTSNPPPFRWLREQCSRNIPDCKKTNAGFLNVPVDEFDAKFFGVSPKEVLCMDPQHRLLHELVWEGLEDACINPQELKGQPGSVFIGSWTNDYRDILSHSGKDEFYRMYMGNSIGAAAARISHLLEMVGPCMATESGCSSAMVAVHLACRSLQMGESNMALACGVNLLLHPFDKDDLPMVISPNGHCKTFCEKADGFARAEGCGVLVLKRLSDAVRDNDNIWGMIRGSAMTQEGISKSMGTPTIHCEALAMLEALRNANVKPEEVSYVEAHGTGTVVGDPLEVAAISKAYSSILRGEPLLIGSVKTNVGHTESCAGITGIIKVLLPMHHNAIPAHKNFEKLNPAIDLDAVPAKIPLESVEWKAKCGWSRIAGVSSFGITGTDAHVIIEEAPKGLPETIWTFEKDFKRPLHLLKLSAKTEEALDELLERYQHAAGNSGEALENLAYSSNFGRANFNQRAVIIAKSKDQLVANIQQHKFMKAEVPSEGIGKICFLFTGQGSQYPGMARQLYSTSPVFKMHFDLCAHILKESYSIEIKQILWGERGSDQISRTIYSQTSIFCVEYALLKLWESWGVRPDCVLGHSLGEFAAAVCAGILRVEDALKLVAERSRLIDQLTGGKMLAIKADKDQVSSLMKQFGNALDYAAINSSEQTVVAGDSDVVLEFSKFCTNNGVKSILLEATHAFHSKHMDPMLDKYGQITSTIEFGPGNCCQFISGMRGGLIPASKVDAEYWVQHTREKVAFLQASKQAVELGCRIFIEVGPQPVLSALTMLNNETPLICLPSLKKAEQEWETILNSLGKLYLKGVPIDWEGFDQFYSRKKVRLPSYPFVGKKFWPDLLSVRGATIHPMLGSPISNASSTKIYQCGLNLSCHEYIRDHAIGENVIVPGAAYLEMCLAAGLATIENSADSLGKPTRPMKVEDLRIEAPLLLQESKTTEVQTVVELNTSSISTDWNDMSAQIFHRLHGECSSSPSWLSHAKATFSPLPTAEETQISFDVQDFKKRLEQESNDDQLAYIHEKLAAISLKFGPSFKRLQRVWKTEEESTFLAKVSLPPQAEGQQCDYILHPTMLDAMIQTIMFSKITSANIKKKLFVPIKIGKFVWLAGNETEETYIMAYDTDSGEKKDSLSTSTCVALLLDGNGKVLAVMSGVEFIDTTVKVIEAVLEQQTTAMPDLWEEVWRGRMGPMQHRQNLQLCNREPFYDEDFRHELMQKYNVMDEEQSSIFSSLDRLVYCYMLQAMYELGWEPPLPGFVISGSGLAAELGIRPQHFRYFSYILQVLQDERILKQIGTDLDKWQVIVSPPTQEQLAAVLNEKVLRDLPQKFESTSLMSNVGENLREILMEKQSALHFLFPEDSKSEKNQLSAASFYTEYGALFKITEVNVQIINKFLSCWKRRQGETDEKFVVRILEIGAGTGAHTKHLLQGLEELEIQFEYIFTDISAAFFPPAQKQFEKWKDSVQYKKLNIEEDPISQGFIPGYYDYIFASEVIHATRDIRESLRNVRCLLKPMGRFDLLEQTRVNRFLTYLFGLLDGFWRFTDTALRPSHCSLSLEGWRDVLDSTGFEIVGTFPTTNDHHSFITTRKTMDEKCSLQKSERVWLLFHHEPSPLSNFLLGRIPYFTSRQVVVVLPGKEFTYINDTFTVDKGSEKDFISVMKAMEEREVEGIIYCWSLDGEGRKQEEILRPYFFLAKSISHLKLRGCPRLIAVTNGVVPLEDSDLVHFPTSTIWGFTKSLRNENTEINCRVIDITSEEKDQEGLMQIFYEIWNDAKETQVAYNGATRYTPKFQSLKATTTDLKLPAGTDRFHLLLPETKSIPDLQFGSLEPFLLGEEEVEIQVKASALNFRDVFSVLKPSEQFKDVNDVGFDFAGVIKQVGSKVTKWSVGDEVFGVNMNGGALPSHVKLGQDDVLPAPRDMTLCEASTLPAVFSTSYYCLMEVAKVTSGDTVLIHTASGGVGLSAVQLCQYIGAKMICTAGSKRKRNCMRSLGIQHVFHSRNTKYGEEILRVTGGRGVDVVLNSLTSEGFKEATLMACAKEARFVEMSKLSIWQPEEVAKLRPDVNYTIVDLSRINGSDLRRLMIATKHLADKNIIRPIPYVQFHGVNIREALQYLQKAKHIGKVVCVMPEVKQRKGQTVTETPMFNPKSTYLITGGLGGIGWLVCQWMVEKGANNVVLAGRNPPNSHTAEAIAHLNTHNNVNVTPVRLDVSNFSECKELLQNKIPQMGYPPLRGVMHCAGILSDGLIQNQEWPGFSSTLKTKVDGTLNLHELTKDSRLEHFVLFSSVAALFGSPGQSNHSAGNNFEDSFAHYRNSVGLPATSINWGQWGQVGVATEVDLPGLKPLSNLQGIAALEYALKSHQTQSCAINIESFVLLGKIYPHFSSYLDERFLKASRGDGSSSLNIKPEEFWELYDSKGDDLEGKLEVVQDVLRKILRTILKLDEADVIQDNQDFQEMGVDSLMFVEIKNALQALLGDRVTLSASALRECNTVELLSTKLVKLMEGDDSAEEPSQPPTMEEVASLIREDCKLPEHIRSRPEQIRIAEKDIKCVLLTGSTGTFGPYMLNELTKLPQISQVICLMRANRQESPLQRLESILGKRDLLREVDMRKVSTVVGDVARPQLGVEPAAWEELRHKVDAVAHCAAYVDHVQRYTAPKKKDNLREVNVDGMKHVLEFSCSGSKLKHVFFTSSLLSVTKVDDDGILFGDWPQIDNFDGTAVMTAYPIMKFMGEILTKTGIDRGIPAKVLRFPIMVGDSKTGRFVLDGNHVMLRYLFIMQSGMMPSVPTPMLMIPVDTCAGVGVKLFFDERARNDIINDTHPRPDLDQEFVQVAKKLGYDVDLVELSEFVKKLRDSSVEDSPFAMFKELYQKDEELLEVVATVPVAKQWMLGGGGEEGRFFSSKKLLRIIPDFYQKLEGSMDCTYRDLLFAREQGWLKKFNLK